MKQHLYINFRNLTRKPIYTFITLTGFTFGIVAILLIYLYVDNELSYEKFHPDYQRIYRVLTLSKDGPEIVKSGGSCMPLSKSFTMDYPQIEDATHICFDTENSPLQREAGGEKTEALCCHTDNNFFQVFNGFIFIEGSAKDVFNKPSNVVLSEKTAMKIFGNQPALGKKLISDKYGKKIYTVSGVVKIPQQSHIDFGFILSEKNNNFFLHEGGWHYKYYVHSYIKLKKNAKIDEALISQLSNQVGRYSGLSDKLMFQPIKDIHLHTDYEASVFDKNIGNIKYVYIFSGLAVFIMLMVILNFSMLSVARASERTTEIGIKKINGANKFVIIKQFISESILLTFIATVLSLLIIWLILPWFNHLTGQQLELNISLRLIINILFITLLVAILAGYYPSHYFSSFLPVKILKGGNTTGSKKGLSHILITVQFSISVFIIIATIFVYKQLSYMQNKDLGFQNKNIVVIPTGLWYDNQDFKNELLKNSSILGVSASVYAPVDFQWKINLTLNHQGHVDSLQTSLFWVDEDFAKTYRLQVTKGQFLQMNYSQYWEKLKTTNKKDRKEKEYENSYPAVINETAEKALGLNDPIGQRIGNFVIVGVVKDFHFRPMQHRIGPILMTNNPENIMTMNVKISPLNQTATLKFIRNTYQKFRDSRDFLYNFFDDLLAEKYAVETRLRNLSLVFSVLAIIISMLGILGMSYIACERRIKEIGIRKVNGAKGIEILAMLNTDFIKWVAVAFIISCPIAWYAMDKWLQSFAYKTQLSWWVFVAAGVVAVAVALITVSWQSFRAAMRNPVEALRYE